MLKRQATLDHDQFFIEKRRIAYGYTCDALGMCVGVALETAVAHLVGAMVDFDQRYIAIHKLSPEEIKQAALNHRELNKEWSKAAKEVCEKEIKLNLQKQMLVDLEKSLQESVQKSEKSQKEIVQKAQDLNLARLSYQAAFNTMMLCKNISANNLNHGEVVTKNMLLDFSETKKCKVTVQALLDAHLNGVAISSLSNFTPLHAAAFFGDIEAVRDLLSRGADFNQKADGISVLDLSKIMNHVAITELLTLHANEQNQSQGRPQNQQQQSQQQAQNAPANDRNFAGNSFFVDNTSTNVSAEKAPDFQNPVVAAVRAM